MSLMSLELALIAAAISAGTAVAIVVATDAAYIVKKLNNNTLDC
jgi:hypothetical protein